MLFAACSMLTMICSFCTASVFNITCINIDRYIAITDPLHYVTRMTPKVAGTMISCTWVISVLLACIPMLIDWFVETSYLYVINDACYFDLSSITGLIVPVFSIYIPSALMLVAYGMIFKVALKQATQIQALAHVAQNLNNGDNGATKKSRKAAKTLGLITGVFLLCWLPLSISFLTAFVFSSNCCTYSYGCMEIVPMDGIF